MTGYNKNTKLVPVLLGDPRRPDLVKPGRRFDQDDYLAVDELKAALSCINDYEFYYIDEHDKMLEELIRLRPYYHIVLNLCDEGFNNDPLMEMHIPAILDVLNMRYTGAGPRCLSYCYDKSLVKSVAKDMGIPVPKSVLINDLKDLDSIHVDFPLIVKPNFGDNSFGITYNSIVWTWYELNDRIRWMRGVLKYKRPIMLEEYIHGDDISVGIVGNPPNDYIFLPIIKEDYSGLPDGLPRICCYEAKWMKGTPYDVVKSVRAELSSGLNELIQNWCKMLFERFECRDYARFDWRLSKDGTPMLLEVNPNPGWVWDGHLNKMASLANISYPELLRMIISAAERRLMVKMDYDILKSPRPGYL
ncbi:MAG: hypothetical protein QXO01_05435 [Nitrososphaerota archaeon]